MAIPTATYTTYDTVGVREDLIDVIVNITPMDTWFTSNSGTARASNRYHEWLTDTLAAPASNAQIEGDDATATAIVPPVRTGNYTQILRKTFQITDTEEMVNKAGRASEESYQKTLKMKELARDIEYALVINASTASGATGTARTLKGVLGWIATNLTTATASTVQFNETDMTSCLQNIWVQGGKPQNVLVGGWIKRKIDAFTTNTRWMEADEKTVAAAIDVYQSSFGSLAIRLHWILNNSQASSVIVLGEMDLWKKAWLRPVKAETLARTGASTKIMVEAELTLEARQEKGSGALTGYATA